MQEFNQFNNSEETGDDAPPKTKSHRAHSTMTNGKVARERQGQ